MYIKLIISEIRMAQEKFILLQLKIIQKLKLLKMRSSTVVKILLCALFSLVFQNSTLAESLSITLTSAGTLSTRLPRAYYSGVTELKLSGPINGSDINELNSMSNLEVLDLSDAKITNGGDSYYGGSGVYLYFTSDQNSSKKVNGKIYYYCNNLTRAFYDNKAIKTVYFPKDSNIKEIGDAAFFNSNIETIYIGDNIQKLNIKPFGNCYNLKNVIVNSLFYTTGDYGYVFEQVASADNKKPLALVPPANKDLVITDKISCVREDACFGSNVRNIYVDTEDIDNLADSLIKGNGVSKYTFIYAYPKMVEKLRGKFYYYRTYSLSIKSSTKGGFNKCAFALDSIVSPYHKDMIKVESVMCNGRPCKQDSTNDYVLENAGLDGFDVQVIYSLAGKRDTLAYYENSGYYSFVSIKSVGQTYVTVHVSALEDKYVKPSEVGVILSDGTRLPQGKKPTDVVKVTGFPPGGYYSIRPYAIYKGKPYEGYPSAGNMKSLDPVITSCSSGVTTVAFEGSWTKLDAVAHRWGWEWNGKVQWTNNTRFVAEGLKPNSTYKARFCVDCNGRISYSAYSSVSTKTITITTLPAECVSDRTARICATTNCDASKGGGFEWRRYDAPDLVPSTYSDCPIINGKMSGSLKNLNANTYYKYRPYYKDCDGTYYFGEWLAFGTADAYVYFEPDVYTSSYTIEDDIVKLKGFVIAGSGRIVKQGFEYWAVNGGSTRSTAYPSAVQVVLVSGDDMEAPLSDLSPNTTYYYRAFATTDNGTIYGTTSQFTSPDAIGINDASATGDALTISLHTTGAKEFSVNRDCAYRVLLLNGATLLQGSTSSDTRISLSSLAKGVYVITANDGLHKATKKIVLK